MNPNAAVPSRTLRRKIASIPFVLNTTLSADIPMEHWYHTLHVRLQGDHVVSSAITLKENGIINLLKNINLKADGTLTPKNTTALMYHLTTMYENQQRPRVLETLLTAATHPFYVDIPIRFRMSNKYYKPYSTLLDSDLFKTFQLFIQTGQLTDVYSAGASTLANCTVEVWAEEIVGKRIERFDLNQETQHDVSWVAANSSLQKELPVNGGFYKRIALRVTDSNIQSDTDVNKITVRLNGTETIFSMTWQELQDMNQNYYHITPIPGFAIIDFDERGDGEELIPTRNLSNMTIEFDVDAATAGKIEMVTQQLFPNPNRAQAA